MYDYFADTVGVFKDFWTGYALIYSAISLLIINVKGAAFRKVYSLEPITSGLWKPGEPNNAYVESCTAVRGKINDVPC